MRIWMIFLLGACGAQSTDAADDAGVASCTRKLPSCPSQAPSYATQIQPIIQSSCVTCHYSGNPSSRFDFSTYSAVNANRGPMLTQVYSCAMPPPDAGALSSDEREALMTWLVCGAPNN